MKKQITIINGPNLNLLGKRDPEIYGSETLELILGRMQERFPDVELTLKQSNHEGDLIDWLQQAKAEDGVILNAGALSHTSYAIRDAIEAIQLPVIEVHLSNIAARESFREKSLLSPVCRGAITGLGGEGYLLALQYLAGVE
jgi:3-dehydroquinate dehydratase II